MLLFVFALLLLSSCCCVVVDVTLLSKASVTSKTFIAFEVSIFGNLDWICQKGYNLPFVHAKFQRTSSSHLAST